MHREYPNKDRVIEPTPPLIEHPQMTVVESDIEPSLATKWAEFLDGFRVRGEIDAFLLTMVFIVLALAAVLIVGVWVTAVVIAPFPFNIIVLFIGLSWGGLYAAIKWGDRGKRCG